MKTVYETPEYTHMYICTYIGVLQITCSWKEIVWQDDQVNNIYCFVDGIQLSTQVHKLEEHTSWQSKQMLR